MKSFTEKLFNFFSPAKILKIIMIFTLFLNINCSSDQMIILFEDPKTNGILSDNIPPNITYVSIYSNNVNPTVAEVGDNITLTFTADEDINTPTVTILGNSATVLGGPLSYTATYVIQGGDPIANVSFIISGIADLAGNTSPNVTGTTDFSNVYNAGTITTPQAIINNPPADPSNDTNLNVSISGTDIVSYQYKVVAVTAPCTGGGYNGSWTPIATNITDLIGPDGDYKLCVIGRNSLNIDQTESMATSYTWEKGLYFWELQVTTTGPSQNMTIGMDGPVNLTIDWGDTIQETTNLTSKTHTYASAGVYTLRIRGQASRIHFDNPDAQARLTGILSVVQGISGLTSFESTFESCDNLTGVIPAGLFDNAPLVTSFQNTFIHCDGLTGSIPSGLFDNNTQVTTFRSTFFGCTGLSGSIPAGLFDNNTLVTTFRSTFTYCGGLSSIPSGLFDNNTLVTTFQNTFHQCLGLTGSIPSGLFDNNTLVTSFYGTFYQCWLLTGSIPSGLFDNNTQVTSFAFTFYDIPGLTGSIPSGLFDNNTLVTTFQGTFLGCTGLTGIPSGLFNNNPLVTSFYGTFTNCTGVTSAVPTLWISHPGASHTQCFMNVTNASNYASIPVAWK